MGEKVHHNRFHWKMISWRMGGAAFALFTALVVAVPVFADEGDHHGVSTTFALGPMVWGVVSLGGVFLFLAVYRVIVVRRLASQQMEMEAPIGYLTAIRQFSRNARLFLTYSILAELGTGIWTVMFNLYLLRIGFPVTFVATFWLVNMLCHATAALPAGLIADRFGRRRSFFIATFISLVAQGMLLFAPNPFTILLLAGVAGFGEAFHGVTGAPFMMENSEPQERPHLFSLNASFLQVSRFVGSLVGGVLPLAWATVFGIPAVEPWAARLALITGLPLTILALVPLAFMREKPVELVESLKDLVTFRNVVHFNIVARLTLLSLMMGTAFGLTVRFFNIFFQDVHSASDSQVGSILALGAMAGASAILIAPVLVQVWGKVKSILFTQALSVPFLLLMASVPSLSIVTSFFLVRGALYSIAQPLRNQLSMEFITSKERGTTAGFTHTAFDLGGGVGAGMAGLLISGGGFATSFSVAAILTLVPAVLYYAFFARMEAEGRQGTAAAVPAVARS